MELIARPVANPSVCTGTERTLITSDTGSRSTDSQDLAAASFGADLSSLTGGTAVVFASGFLTPDSNQGGQPFGLFAALANGTVVPFDPLTMARLQVIHNAADPAADSVDIYVNGLPFSQGFAFRTATPFGDVPAGGHGVRVSGRPRLRTTKLKNFLTEHSGADNTWPVAQFRSNPRST